LAELAVRAAGAVVVDDAIALLVEIRALAGPRRGIGPLVTLRVARGLSVAAGVAAGLPVATAHQVGVASAGGQGKDQSGKHEAQQLSIGAHA
jgi:hypothetical protein